MAAWTDDPVRREVAFRSIEAMLDELPSLADDWLVELSIDEQIAWSLEWGNEMAKLCRLAEADGAGQFDPHNRQRFRTLAERAVRLLPVAERINLRRPDDVVLEAGGSRVSA